MRLTSLLAFIALSGCSLIVQFDPDSQPCEANGACLSTHTCVNGICRPRGDAGVDSPTDGGLDDGGNSGCQATEASCGNGVDDDCDGKIDCLDADCNALGCNDGDPCTTGEVCGSNACQRGAAKVCNSPAPCEVPIGTCEASTGQCVYAKRADGASCGSTAAARCCGGTCTDVNTDAANCGGCGLACTAGQACQDVGDSCGRVATSGRCRCSAGSCPQGQGCNLSGLCVPSAASACALGQVVLSADAGCPTFCAYP